jgi:ATP-binding cassette subfamily F protein uup
VLIVSHDRDFLDKTVTVTLGLDGSGKVDIVAGGYEDWIKRKVPSTPAKAGAQSSQAQRGDSALRESGPPPARGNKKLSFKDQRDLDRLPAEVDRLEREIAATETLLHDPDLYSKNPARFADLTRQAETLRADKDAAEMRWLEVAEMAEQLDNAVTAR